MRAESRSQRLASEKPTKPQNFPLTPSGGGSWVKKINGKLFTFGPWGDQKGALKAYYSELDFIQANGYRPAESDRSKLTVKDFTNRFLAAQYERADAPEGADEKISNRHYNDLHHTCSIFVEVVGEKKVVNSLTPEDFTKVRRVFSKKQDGSLAAPATIAGHVRRTKAMLNWAHDQLVIDHPIRTGKGFKVPSKKTFRRHRNSQPEKIFSPEEIHGMIALAPVTIKAAIWLGINCGLNNSDVGSMPLANYENRTNGWIHYPRNKNAMFRKLLLWQETIAAIDAMVAKRVRPKSKAAAKLLFNTKYGNGFGNTTISTEIQKLKRRLNIKRDGCGFNSLRHCVETFGGRDQTAINTLMGHVDPHISSEYREILRFPKERLTGVTDTIRTWLGEDVSGSESEATDV